MEHKPLERKKRGVREGGEGKGGGGGGGGRGRGRGRGRGERGER